MYEHVILNVIVLYVRPTQWQRGTTSEMSLPRQLKFVLALTTYTFKQYESQLKSEKTEGKWNTKFAAFNNIEALVWWRKTYAWALVSFSSVAPIQFIHVWRFFH